MNHPSRYVVEPLPDDPLMETILLPDEPPRTTEDADALLSYLVWKKQNCGPMLTAMYWGVIDHYLDVRNSLCRT